LSIDLEENLNFHVTNNTFVDIDANELNDILITNRHTKVDEDDDIDEHQFNIEDYGGHDDDENKEEEEEYNSS
jgi:hypothetical protein